MATVSPPQLDMSESSRRDVTIVADKHPIVWKAFTTDAEHFKLRPGAGVLRPKEAATAVASINKRLDKVAARIAVKRLTPQEFADYTKMTGSDSAKKTWDNVCLVLLAFRHTQTHTVLGRRDQVSSPRHSHAHGGGARGHGRARLPCRSRLLHSADLDCVRGRRSQLCLLGSVHCSDAGGPRCLSWVVDTHTKAKKNNNKSCREKKRIYKHIC